MKKRSLWGFQRRECHKKKIIYILCICVSPQKPEHTMASAAADADGCSHRSSELVLRQHHHLAVSPLNLFLLCSFSFIPSIAGHGFLSCPKPRMYRDPAPGQRKSFEWTNWMGKCPGAEPPSSANHIIVVRARL